MPIKPSNNHLNPHDRFFRAMMREPKVIREFFEQNLPSNIKAVIDFATIQLQQESFIDDKLKLQIADLLYSAEFSRQEGYLYLLAEHQSTPDKLMPFRILRYMVAIMEYHLKKTKRDELPIIYPVIFYTGNRSYNYSTDLFDLFGARKELAKDILWQPYQLIDLSKTPDEKLKEFLRYGIIAKTMKYIYKKDFIPILKELVKDLRTIENFVDVSYIYTILSYIIEAGELDKQEFIATVKAGLTQVSEVNIMTLAEQFRQEGRQEGMVLAEKCKQETLMTISAKLLNQGMSIEQIALVTELPIKEIEKIKNDVSN